MARPRGPKNYTDRLRAYELYAGGLTKAAIARDVGVTRGAINNWSKEDHWEDKLAAAVTRAEEAVIAVHGDVIAELLNKLRGKARQRVAELETLCGPSQHPTTRLKAIQLWLKLAGMDRALPDPSAPTEPKSLRLIEDLTETNLVGND